jgi:enoyl-CoA hydratase
MAATLLVDRPRDGILQVTLNRPEHGNGVVPELALELLDVLDRADRDGDVRAMVLTGAGRQFCAGADLPAFQAHLRDVLPVTGEPFNARVLHPVVLRMRAVRFPIIAAINGGATAGGLDLALACDLRIASEAARLGETYVRIGLPPGTGGAWFLPRLVGSAVAAELALTGDLVDAPRALELGLVSRVVAADDLIPAALDLASRIARWPSRAVEATKAALRGTWDTDLAGHLGASYWAVAALQHTRDVAEGVDAALHKREPRFNAGDAPATPPPTPPSTPTTGA